MDRNAARLSNQSRDFRSLRIGNSAETVRCLVMSFLEEIYVQPVLWLVLFIYTVYKYSDTNVPRMILCAKIHFMIYWFSLPKTKWSQYIFVDFTASSLQDTQNSTPNRTCALPSAGRAVGRSKRRFIFLPAQSRQRTWPACADCDQG